MIPILGLFILAFGTLAHGHGMDKPGPHGGYIRMPGVHHIELVPSGQGSWKVYLLTENFREPTIHRSSVSGHLETERGKVALRCSALKDHFQCSPETPVTGAPVLLRLQSQRNGGPQGVATYRLPLKWGN